MEAEQPMSSAAELGPLDFSINVLKDHEVHLHDLVKTVLSQPVKHYTDKEGRLDRELVSQQIAARSTLLLSLSNQFGRLQMALYSLAAQGIGIDYGELLNEMSDAQAQYEDAMDRIYQRSASFLPISPAAEPDGPSDYDEEVRVMQAEARQLAEADVALQEEMEEVQSPAGEPAPPPSEDSLTG